MAEITHIEVKKILQNQIYDESILISDIKSFRPWRKKENDKFAGEATFLVLKANNDVKESKKPKEDEEEGDEKKKQQLPTMLIQESYTNFLRRMSGKVVKK